MPVLSAAIRPEQRATMRSEESWWRDVVLGGQETTSGERVNEQTALAVSAYFACIRNISQDIAKLPLKPFKPLQPRGSEALRDHATFSLVHDQPNPEMTAMTFWETLMAHALGWKGGFAEIVQTQGGVARQLWPMDPTRMRVWRNRETMELVYEVTMDDGSAVRLPPRKVLHIHGLGMDGITSFVIAHINRESIGNAMAAQTHSAAFFGNGAIATGHIEVPGVMKKEALHNLRESFADRYAGSKKHYKPIILEDKAQWKQVSFDPEKSQLIETQEFTGKNVCRAFRMPPHKVGYTDSQPRANVEQENISYIGDTLVPWIRQVEQACRWKLLLPREQKAGIFFKHNVRALLRGDMQQQAAFFQSMIQNGVYSPDDVRELLDENPLPDDLGDTYLVNGTMIPLDVAASKTAEPAQPAIPAEPQPVEDEPTEPEDTRAAAGVLNSHEILLTKEIDRLCKVESDKIKRAREKDRLGDRFWDQSRQYASDVIGPILRALIGSMDAIHAEPLNGQSDAIIAQAIELHMQRTMEGDNLPDRGLKEAKTMIEDVRNAYGTRKTQTTAP